MDDHASPPPVQDTHHVTKTTLCLALFTMALVPTPAAADDARADGYRGIWFTLGQKSQHGDKYSGGLGTYTAKHIPLAVYSKEAAKTFFVWGGTRPGERHLLAMASHYDHRTNTVPRPVIVHDKKGVNDPHDNPSLAMDDDGHLWVFVAGRSTRRDGFLYRSVAPHSIDAFELVHRHRRMAYPQPWRVKRRGFCYLYTRYTKGRELYWRTIPNTRVAAGSESIFTAEQKLAGFGGHYQVTRERDGRVVTAFSWHPRGVVDRRTNLYFLETRDMGKTWTTAAGERVTTPLAAVANPALVRDYHARGELVYLKDIDIDDNGRPVVLFVVSRDHRPGPQKPPRMWTTARFSGSAWDIRTVTPSDHNYDMGSLYLRGGGDWTIVAPTDPGPQPWGTGGEMVVWSSADRGRTWKRVRTLTRNSPRNHAYARRPVDAHPGFWAFWADGNPDAFSKSHLYFTTRDGRVFRLPPKMTGPTATPEPVAR